MAIRYKKIIAAVAGVALSAVIASPLLPDQVVLAKWLPWSQGKTTVAHSTVEVVDDVETVDKAVKAESNAPVGQVDREVVVADHEGKPVRVEVTSQKTVQAVAVDETESNALQAEVNAGKKHWLLNPVDVVRNNAKKYGFDATKDSFTLMNQQGEAGLSRILVRHGERYYMVTLAQPVGSGNNKIWQVKSLREVRVVEKDTPDVGAGVIGLNYDKVINWQQNVDEGRELWRLDPLSVAREEGKAYGFTSADSFSIVKHYASTTLARHGEIHVQVKQQGKDYTMILVRPLGSDEGAIWTTYRVSGIGKVEQPPTTGKVLFSTDTFSGWNWRVNQYLPDMAFTTIVDYKAQLLRIPASLLEKVKDIDYRKQVVLFAYLGAAPSGGYGIGIEKVSINANNLTVQVRTNSPRPGQAVTLAITHPSDFVTLDRQIVDIWGGVNVSFVDEKGTVLSKTKLVISHR